MNSNGNGLQGFALNDLWRALTVRYQNIGTGREEGNLFLPAAHRPPCLLAAFWPTARRLPSVGAYRLRPLPGSGCCHSRRSRYSAATQHISSTLYAGCYGLYAVMAPGETRYPHP